MAYRVEATRQFEKQLIRLPLATQQRIVERVHRVAEHPHASDPNLMKLQGREGYRLRVGDYRVIYELHHDRLVLLLVDVGHRGGIYQ